MNNEISTILDKETCRHSEKKNAFQNATSTRSTRSELAGKGHAPQAVV